VKKNNNNNGVVKLWGHDFNRTKSGLDEEQVVSFTNELISERDTLIERQEHLSSLLQLAERTVAEADNVAKQVKEEAVNQAKADADAIVAQAEEQAQQIIEEKRAEAVAIAEKEVEAIKANAKHEAELLLEERVTGVQSELRNTAQRLCAEFLSQLESLKQQVTALEADFEQALSQRMKQTAPTTMVEEDNVIMTTEAPEQIETIGQSDTSELETETLVSAEDEETVDYEVGAELEILPPVDMGKVTGIMDYLNSLPKVKKTALIPLTDKPLIEVFLREPIPLVDALRMLPEVERVEEIKDGEGTATTDATHGEGKLMKIHITLSGKSVLDETKERLNSKVSRILSL